MNPTSNHDELEQPKATKLLRAGDFYSAQCNYRTQSFLGEKSSVISPELVINFNIWHVYTLWTIAAIPIFGVLVFLVENGYLIHFGNPQLGFWANYFPGILSPPINLMISFIVTRHFADIRYLVFKKDKVTMQSKYLGRREYETKDLKFHLIEKTVFDNRYFLEVEIPDESIPEHKRIIRLETAASTQTMDGVISVFLSLIKGDLQPYVNAHERRYQPIPEGRSRNIFMRLQNLLCHIHVFCLSYTINNILFWLVHGPRQNVINKERERE